MYHRSRGADTLQLNANELDRCEYNRALKMAELPTLEQSLMNLLILLVVLAGWMMAFCHPKGTKGRLDRLGQLGRRHRIKVFAAQMH